MIIYNLPGYFWIWLGFFLAFVVFAVRRKAISAVSYSVITMFIASLGQALADGFLAHVFYVVGSVGVGMFLGGVVLILIRVLLVADKEEIVFYRL